MTDRTTRPWARLATVLAPLLVLAASACGGLADDSAPTLVADDRLPAELAEEQTGSADPPGATVDADVYLIYSQESADELIVACRVKVQERDTLARQATVRLVRLIEEDPTAESSPCADFLTNAIPPELEVLDLAVANDVVIVDLANLAEVESAGQRRAIAQIVYTLTDDDLGELRGVRFLLDGEPAPVPVGERPAEAGSVITRADFPAFDDTRATNTTTTTTPRAATPVPAEPPIGDPG